MSDQTYIVILRLLHIGFGLFWAGSALFFAMFLMPSLKASGPDGVKFMQALGRSGYPIAAMISAIITIISGFLLIWKLSAGFDPIWFKSWYARVLTTGASMAVIAFIIGFTVNRPCAAKMNKISMAISQQGTPPTPDQLNEIMALRKKLFMGTNYIALLLVIAVAGMSVFRYVG
jgi:hypothetical protein